MPRERFISYPTASPDSDNSLLLGWAGWDHGERAHALVTLMEERSTSDGWGASRLVPLLAGLAELMPSVRQWRAEVDDRFSTSPADAYDTYLTFQCQRYGLIGDDLSNWTAPPIRRGRPRRLGPPVRQAAKQRSGEMLLIYVIAVVIPSVCLLLISLKILAVVERSCIVGEIRD